MMTILESSIIGFPVADIDHDRSYMIVKLLYLSHNAQPPETSGISDMHHFILGRSLVSPTSNGSA